MTATAPRPTFLPHDGTPEEQHAAGNLSGVLGKAASLGRWSMLTPAEIDLLTALRLRLRSRFGLDEPGAYEEMTERLLAAAKAISEEVPS